MRPIHLAHLDKVRPAVVLTRELVRPHLADVTVALITTRARGLSTEVAVGPENGLAEPGVINCDHIHTIPATALGRQLGYLLPHQEPALSRAVMLAFDLERPAPL